MSKPIYKLFDTLLRKVMRDEIIPSDLLRFYRDLSCKYREGDISALISILVNGILEGTILDDTIEIVITDGVNPVTPNSVGIVGRTVTIDVQSGGGTPSGVLFKPSQSNGEWTIYDTTNIDAGALVQLGWYNSIPVPPNPKAIAQLDLSLSNHHFRLKDPLVVNGVSSNIRFVDVNGVQAFTSTGNANRVLIDKLTGYMWHRYELNGTLTNLGTPLLWQAALDLIDSFSLTVNGITYDDWVCPTMQHWSDLTVNHVQSTTFSDGAVLLMLVNSGITGNTVTGSTINAWRFIFNTFQSQGKTGAGFRVYAVRKAHNLITAP